MRMHSMAIAVVVAGVTGTAAANLHLATSAPNYDPGQTVVFTVRNDHAEAVEIPAFPYWKILEQATGDLGAPCTSLPTIHSIDPGEEEQHSWNQLMCDGGLPATPGTYLLRVDYYLESAPGVYLQSGVPFCIGGGCDLPVGVEDRVVESPWGRVKASYR